ncbi:MFS transporter [Gilliamella apicola]|uniref:LysR family transcriptional regulator n=1 Tax=Gilliamella apicola TaxID=1196095 RepID=A0A242NFN3_9GAMM|nr:MFS transporter [Gilliamella apicola]OTP81938.1 LysR family transcriptional regulator [Gilliamella apicola]OTP85393.1 LysR family transcriptional regulator [Gilliamella apicola]OTP98404.1 LysR family transcriptional regulator [Gilliamella apicola]OTQ08389.1 LysR family transcriptional regulator [Gilliamella apicola]OTQ14817.1 LysR family transcriptional regulator [Gilliamella apicola]
MPNSSAKKVAFAAFIGTTIEWYDFYIYALASVLIFGQLFFPSDNQFVQVLGTFATFAVGFLSRPLGAILFGHIGDRLGRKKSLIITLLLMGIATTCVGLLPSYQEAGIIAPILLVALRILQGVAVGGEWGGAVLMANEHAPKGLKNFFSSFAQWGSPAGNILALLVFSYIIGLPIDQLINNGYWRIPFLASFILLIVGLIARVTLTESPVFIESCKKQASLKEKESVPIIDVFKQATPILLLAICANVLSFSGIFSNTLMIGYTTMALGVEKKTIVDALFWIAVVHFIAQPFISYFSEKFSATRFLIVSAILAMASVFLLFPIIQSGTKISFIIGISLNVICYSGFYGVIAGYLSRIFPTRIRYTGLSMSYQGCAAIFGSLIPMIGAYIIYTYKTYWLPLALFYCGLALLSIISIYLLSKYHYYDE